MALPFLILVSWRYATGTLFIYFFDKSPLTLFLAELSFTFYQSFFFSFFW